MRERPVSVTIFGILNIGFGLLGLAGLLTQSLFTSFATQAPNPSLSSVMAFLDEMNKNPTFILWRNISVPLEGVASLALLVAGIGLMLLKNWARVASVSYGVYKIVFDLANIVILYLALGDILQKALKNFPAAAIPIAAVLALVGVLLTMTYPALLIFFLTRRKNVAAFQPAPPVSTL
jgi:hypothetical protein